ncbi:hypothetical protein PCC6912_39710 [Chlorogloeopsis fritschii PCC 6912]|uniref:Uncharacterized protein n=1 Tax=Chlorogloeopsis fritschii PCC 6912 TaxID=211165 RepID=A0A433N6A0_CHLFR|nr:hypothetical protein [Chlorogloeopsis fritschii]RUR77012.1 hypothetical protein PCC6912_39710 [Chlorogloeopsis fritschii PCC 6912]
MSTNHQAIINGDVIKILYAESNTNKTQSVDGTQTLIKAIDNIQKVEPKLDLVTGINVLVLVAAIIACIGSLFSNLRLIKLPSEPRDIGFKIKASDLEQDKQIEAYLNRMMGITGASRVLVSMFHNGDKIGKYHFRYLSVFWEVCNENVVPCKPNYQKLDFSIVRYEVEKCMKNNGYFISYSVNDNLDENYRLYLLKNNSQAVVSRLIGDDDDGYEGQINIHLPYLPKDSEIPYIFSKLNPIFELLEAKIIKPFTST